jgi:hypothetical protein
MVPLQFKLPLLLLSQVIVVIVVVVDVDVDVVCLLTRFHCMCSDTLGHGHG